jgi:YidC/Oxa1 family membrane protein insertase
MFIKQVHYQRHMQEMQPKISALREKYKSDRAEMNRQMMALQQEQGFNPLSGCLPMFLQIPIFISLYHTLRHLSNSVAACNSGAVNSHLTLYSFTRTQTCDAAKAKLFNAPLAASLHDAAKTIMKLGGDATSTRVVSIILVIISASATYLTQRLVMSRATVIPTGTQATIQRAMVYLIPFFTLTSGLIFPLGVLLYWFTSNTWTLGQQFYINRYHPPTPSTVQPTGQLGKTLAPKPGQKPTRGGAPSRPNMSKDSPPPATAPRPVADRAAESEPAPPPNTVPKPGQRPVRPAGNRPPGKKPSQAKKRR